MTKEIVDFPDDRLTVSKFIGGPIGAPGPPSRATLTLVKFLPFLAAMVSDRPEVIVAIDRRSPIQPDFLGR
jgi:hypothetical protein